MDEGSLICDLAETYGILTDYHEYTPIFIATLTAGLGRDSRVVSHLEGRQISMTHYLAAYNADRLANLVWMQTKDGVKGKNQPQSILQLLIGNSGKAEKKALRSFDSPDELKAALRKYEV